MIISTKAGYLMWDGLMATLEAQIYAGKSGSEPKENGA